MEKKIITINEFQNVARNNKYFLWHFLQKKQGESELGLHSYFEKIEGKDNKIKELIDLLDIPYFESYVEDSMDFLNGLGISYERLWTPNGPPELLFNQRFSPILIGFNRFNKVLSTMDRCYCVDGILEVVSELNPEFLLSINTED
jgi:hypothetical protein